MRNRALSQPVSLPVVIVVVLMFAAMLYVLFYLTFGREGPSASTAAEDGATALQDPGLAAPSGLAAVDVVGGVGTSE